MPETTPLIKAALNLRVGAGFDVYFSIIIGLISKSAIDCFVWYGFRDMITHIIVWIVIEHKTCRVKLLQLILPYIITNDIEN